MHVSTQDPDSEIDSPFIQEIIEYLLCQVVGTLMYQVM